MSYVLEPILIDVDTLEAVTGCKDPSLVEAIKAANPSAYKQEDDKDELSLAVALRQLIMGEPRDKDSAHQYGYALREICAFKGEALAPDVWSGVRWEAIKDCGLESVLATGAPVDLPPIPDFPTIGYIKREALAKQLQRASELRTKLNRKVEGGLWTSIRRALGSNAGIRARSLLELVDEYIGWLETAEKKGKDIVFFYQ